MKSLLFIYFFHFANMLSIQKFKMEQILFTLNVTTKILLDMYILTNMRKNISCVYYKLSQFKTQDLYRTDRVLYINMSHTSFKILDRNMFL